MTLTSITDYDEEEMKGGYEYLAEDEKGFLLKCEYPDDMAGHTLYEMFYARYLIDLRDIGGEKKCSVWQCSFEVKDGIIEAWGENAPMPHYSKIDNCAGEKDEWNDFPSGGPKMNCLDELKERGWEKYIPGKWVKKVNTWQ